MLTNPPITMNKDSWQYQRMKYALINIVSNVSKGLIGTPRIMGGKDPQTGLDCSGFTKYVYGNAGYMLPAGSKYQYGYFKDNNMLFQTPQPGDLFFYKDGDTINHTGIVLDVSGSNITIIDSVTQDESGRNVYQVNERTINMETNNYWKSHIAGFGRLIE